MGALKGVELNRSRFVRVLVLGVPPFKVNADITARCQIVRPRAVRIACARFAFALFQGHVRQTDFTRLIGKTVYLVRAVVKSSAKKLIGLLTSMLLLITGTTSIDRGHQVAELRIVVTRRPDRARRRRCARVNHADFGRKVLARHSGGWSADGLTPR